MISTSNINFKYFVQLVVGFIIGVVAACSPTKFTSTAAVDGSCQSSTQNCVHTDGYNSYSPVFKVGAGKVDILFIDDNSASMSFEQKSMASRFAGFVEQLDQKEIDYRIAITTTDLNAVRAKRLLSFGNGHSYLTKADSNRVGLFNAAIVRQETVACESFIKGAINSYGDGWQSDSRYMSQYPQMCPSSDERGTYTSSLVLEENTDSFVRSDANLNIIVISDENVRSAAIVNNALTSSTGAFEDKDKYESFISMMNNKYPSKYWEFNSIVAKDDSCVNIQSQQIVDVHGVGVVGSSIGYEYAKLSNSAAKDIDGNPRPRGQILDICQNDYSSHFNSIATQISDASRLFTLECKPDSAPVVTNANNSSSPVTYTWDGNRSIVFPRSLTNTSISIKYRCYKGVQ